jgi:hypothetical protein
MSNLHDFLVEHAKFPFPQPNEGPSAGTTDISLIEVPLLEREWKANHAVRDNTLVQKLCSTLENILGDTILAVDDKNLLLSRFSPRMQLNVRGREQFDWRRNPSESHVSVLTVHSKPSNLLIFGTESDFVDQRRPPSFRVLLVYIR